MHCPDVDFFELRREMLHKGASFRFHARGRSMFPLIREGDILYIESACVSELRRGDIVFYQDCKRVVAHRLIKRISGSAGDIFVVKGDFTFGRADTISSADILGRVKEIQRENRRICLGSVWGRLRSSFYYGASLLMRLIYRFASGTVNRIQALRLYRRIVKRMLRPDVSCDWDCRSASEGCLLVRCGKKIIGRVTITDFSDQDPLYKGWWIFDMWVYWRYRALGLGERLTRMACDFAAERGGRKVQLLVFEDNIAARKLYEKSGFIRTAIAPIDNELKAHAKQTGRLRIIMAKQLCR